MPVKRGRGKKAAGGVGTGAVKATGEFAKGAGKTGIEAGKGAVNGIAAAAPDTVIGGGWLAVGAVELILGLLLCATVFLMAAGITLLGYSADAFWQGLLYTVKGAGKGGRQLAKGAVKGGTELAKGAINSSVALNGNAGKLKGVGQRVSFDFKTSLKAGGSFMLSLLKSMVSMAVALFCVGFFIMLLAYLMLTGVYMQMQEQAKRLLGEGAAEKVVESVIEDEAGGF